MTDVQRADLDAAQRGKKFNDDNNLLLETISDDDLPPIITEIEAQIGLVEEAEAKQQHDYGDVGNEKEQLKKEMAKQVVRFALRAKTKAARLGLNNLADSLNHPETHISQADGDLAVTRANDMKKAMDDNKGPSGVLTNIKAADIAVMTAAIKAFDLIKDVPTSNVKVKKAEGTDRIQPEVTKLNGLIQQEANLLHSYWDGTVNEKFANEFELQTHAVVLGSRHNIVEVTLLKDEDGKPLNGGLVTCLKNGKTSDGNGTNVYEIVGIQVGNASFKAEAEGRVSADFDVVVVRSTKVSVTVKMKLV